MSSHHHHRRCRRGIRTAEWLIKDENEPPCKRPAPAVCGPVNRDGAWSPLPDAGDDASSFRGSLSPQYEPSIDGEGSRSPLVVKDDVPSHRLSIPSPQYEEEEDALTPAQGGLRIDLPTALLDFANAMVESGEPDTIFEGKVKIAHDRQCVVCAKIYKAGDDMCKMNVDVVLEIREHPITPP